MSTNYSCSLSVELVSYLTGDLSKREIKKLETHLLDCPSCSLELKELQEAWKMIPYNFEQVEAPSDLKEQVMNSIFLSEDTAQQTEEQVQRLVGHKSKSNRSPFITFVVAAALLLTSGGLIWSNLALRQEVAELKNQSQLPIKVSQVFTLNSANPSHDSAQGRAWLYRQGENQQLVLQFHGLAETKGSETFQVWLIHNGERKSAGVFHVDKKGNGSLTYKLDDKDMSVDSIGVSLEPDANGNQPRGKKILGT